MPDESLTFRCPQCQKLLRASVKRAGTTVLCPRCQSALIVPGHPSDEEAPDGSGPPTFGVDPGGLSDEPTLQTMIPGLAFEPERFSLRSEDSDRGLRVPDRGRERARAEPPAATAAAAPAVDEPAPGPAPAPSEEPSSPADEGWDAGPVRIEGHPSLLSPDPGARRDDVVMPRAAVLLWSFAMLLGLVMAFTAGLLAGHFLWTTEGVALPRATLAPPSSASDGPNEESPAP